MFWISLWHMKDFSLFNALLVKSLYMCFLGKRRIEETRYKAWVGQLILISVSDSVNFGQFSAFTPAFSLVYNGEDERKSELGNLVSQHCTCFLANIQLILAGGHTFYQFTRARRLNYLSFQRPLDSDEGASSVRCHIIQFLKHSFHRERERKKSRELRLWALGSLEKLRERFSM